MKSTALDDENLYFDKKTQEDNVKKGKNVQLYFFAAIRKKIFVNCCKMSASATLKRVNKSDSPNYNQINIH